MRSNRFFFIAVVGAIVLVLAVFVIIAVVQGGHPDRGDTGDDPYGRGAPGGVTVGVSPIGV